MSTDFYPGQRVVCIADQWLKPYEAELPPVCPKKGLVYTIRGATNEGIFVGLALEEILCPLHKRTGREFNWSIKAFKPLKESNLDVFRETFVTPKTPTPEPVKEKENENA